MNGDDPEVVRLTQAAAGALAQRAFDEARRLAQALLLRAPGNPHARQILGFVALEMGDEARAKDHILAANAAAANDPQVLNASGVALRRMGLTAAARDAFTRAGALGLIDAWRNLGNLENLAGNIPASVAAYERALKMSPRDPAAHASLAHAFESLHDLQRAKQHAEQALAGDAANEIARLALAQILMREKDFAAAEAMAASVTQSARFPANQTLAWGLVGEARDRQGNAPGAFAAFTASNTILRSQNAALLGASHLPHHPDGIARMTRVAEVADVSQWRAPDAAPAPVFLVGFPRSGTTLLDQILASHSRIVCLEEEDHFVDALGDVLADPGRVARMAEMDAAEIEAAQAEYWRRVRSRHAIPDGAIVIDKLPLNIAVLPLIKRVFPNAKIIFALRDPRDVILSCYQQRFGMNAAMARFLDLGDAAAYYDAVMRLMLVCRERLELDLIQVRYEDVVADLKAAARGLCDFLGVAFEQAMLDFQATALKRTIQTPSARQVIEPLYNRSIARWRRYANELAPALPVLDPWVRRFGYES